MKKLRIVAILLTVVLLGSVLVSNTVAQGSSSPPSGASEPNPVDSIQRFRDTSEEISVRPSNIVWDEKNDPYAVRIEWDLAQRGRSAKRFSVDGPSPIPFNYAALYWVTDEYGKEIRPEDFTVSYGSRKKDRVWDKPKETKGTVHPFKAQSGLFVAPFHLILGDEPRETFAVSISAPKGVTLRSVTLILAHHFGATAMSDAQGQSTQLPLSTGGPYINGGGSGSARPIIIPRASWWGNLPPAELTSPRWLPQYRNITHAVIHHTDPAHNNQATAVDAANWVRSIWRWHATQVWNPNTGRWEGHNWGDIGYNFIIDRFGNIYHGRHNPQLDASPPQDVIGAHAGGFNTGTMGVAFLGDFTSGLPSAVALSSGEQLLAWRFRLRGLDPLAQAVINNRSLFRIFGHRDVSPGNQCPGNALYNHLPTMRTNVAFRMR